MYTREKELRLKVELEVESCCSAAFSFSFLAHASKHGGELELYATSESIVRCDPFFFISISRQANHADRLAQS